MALLLKVYYVRLEEFLCLDPNLRSIITHGHCGTYPEDRIEAVFANQKTLALIVLVLTYKDHGDNVLLAIAALKKENRTKFLNFICDHHSPTPIITGFLQELDEKRSNGIQTSTFL